MSADTKAIVDAINGVHDILWWCALWLFLLLAAKNMGGKK